LRELSIAATTDLRRSSHSSYNASMTMRATPAFSITSFWIAVLPIAYVHLEQKTKAIIASPFRIMSGEVGD